MQLTKNFYFLDSFLQGVLAAPGFNVTQGALNTETGKTLFTVPEAVPGG